MSDSDAGASIRPWVAFALCVFICLAAGLIASAAFASGCMDPSCMGTGTGTGTDTGGQSGTSGAPGSSGGTSGQGSPGGSGGTSNSNPPTGSFAPNTTTGGSSPSHTTTTTKKPSTPTNISNFANLPADAPAVAYNPTGNVVAGAPLEPLAASTPEEPPADPASSGGGKVPEAIALVAAVGAGAGGMKLKQQMDKLRETECPKQRASYDAATALAADMQTRIGKIQSLLDSENMMKPEPSERDALVSAKNEPGADVLGLTAQLAAFDAKMAASSAKIGKLQEKLAQRQTEWQEAQNKQKIAAQNMVGLSCPGVAVA
jgi:hypothetical protein